MFGAASKCWVLVGGWVMESGFGAILLFLVIDICFWGRGEMAPPLQKRRTMTNPRFRFTRKRSIGYAKTTTTHVKVLSRKRGLNGRNPWYFRLLDNITQLVRCRIPVTPRMPGFSICSGLDL